MKIIASALIQWVTRTQIGWMTWLAGLVSVTTSNAWADMIASVVREPSKKTGLASRHINSRLREWFPTLSPQTGRGRQAFVRDRGLGGSHRQQHRVDHVDHAVRLQHIRDCDHGNVPLGVGDRELAGAGLLDPDVAARNGLELGGAFAVLDGF